MTQAPGSFVAQGCSFEGKLAFGGSARIDGHVRGEIRADGLLIVGAQGRVEAEVEVGSARIEGEFSGSLRAKESVELAAGARLEGSVDAPRLAVCEGAVICARVRMGERGG